MHGRDADFRPTSGGKGEALIVTRISILGIYQWWCLSNHGNGCTVTFTLIKIIVVLKKMRELEM